MFGRRSAARRNSPGLVNTVARTAVIAGTAQATANAVNSSAARKQDAQAAAVAQTAAKENAIADLQQQVDALQAQELQAAAPAPAAAAQSDLITKLTQLSELHAAGILTDEEFAAAKAKALSS